MPRLPAFRIGVPVDREGIAVEDGHSIEMAGKRLGRGQAADPGADDNGPFSERVPALITPGGFDSVGQRKIVPVRGPRP